jgi:hypothetical protein
MQYQPPQQPPYQPGASPQPFYQSGAPQPPPYSPSGALPPQSPPSYAPFQQQPTIYGPGSGFPPPVSKPKKRRRWPWIVGALVLVVLIIMGAAANAGNNSQDNATPTPQATNQPAQAATGAPISTPQPTSTPTPTFAQFGDGTFVVGKDIQPGTYRTREPSAGCYFARLRGFGGTVDDIIANENTDYPAIVTIAATDKGFQSNNCGTWTKNLSAITTSNTSFGDGMYIVGTDIKPGTYKSKGQQGCYFARLRGFGGTIDDIIANDNTDTAAIVTISPSDKGFQSDNCGTWTRL